MTTTVDDPTQQTSVGSESSRRMTHKRSYNRDRNGPIFYVVLVLIALLFIVPVLWMFLTSFRVSEETRAIPIQLIPRHFSLRGYRMIFDPASDSAGANPVPRWFLNSLVVSTLGTIWNLVVAAMAAYPLARMQFRGRNLLFGTLIATMFIPGFIFLMPNYLTMDKLQWLDSYWALVVPGAAGAFGVFFLRQFFLSIPRELEESALIDGANQWTIFTRIILPLSKPALVTLATLSFLGHWNDFIWPLFVLFSPEKLTLAPGLATLKGAYVTDYPVVMAGATVAAVPVLILYVILQRYVIEGVASSGLKG
ncbi:MULTISPECIES: carbohydrate ABC transporter permease [Aestuariimicrobium]|uniref:carbohydrate ABC transporter permease n=1 Tax=Aestuariimicrobium TaxID=396388 RepID=UPI0003B6A9C6|nr:L-arabinose transport system permease protein AraQ [Aestuariimicrobium sp. T2.26MG-19.2B]